MFMGKSERINIRKLLKLRLRDCKGIQIIGILLVIIFIVEIPPIIEMLKIHQTYPNMISLSVFSDMALGILSFAIIYYCFQYSEYNENHQIYPHTNTTNFIAFELYCYLMNVILQLAALGLYLLLYLLCQVIIKIDGSFHLACPFSLPFIITGFFVTLCNGFLITSILILAATLVRKFRWWAIAIYLSILAALWFTKDQHISQGMIDFYSKETSITIFFLKAIGTLLILEVLNQVLQPQINSTKVKKFNYPQLIIAIFILVSFFTSSLAFNQRNNMVTDIDQVTPSNPIHITNDKPVCILDAGGLASGSTLNINYEVESMYYCNRFIENDDSSDHQIRIYFISPIDMRNNINLSNFTNPKVEATLTGHNLNLRIIHDTNVKIVAIAPYTAPMQFDCFRSKPYSTNYIWSSSTSSPGSIEIVLPESMKLNTEENITQLQISQ